jgi:hypothetical protein
MFVKVVKANKKFSFRIWSANKTMAIKNNCNELFDRKSIENNVILQFIDKDKSRRN